MERLQRFEAIDRLPWHVWSAGGSVIVIAYLDIFIRGVQQLAIHGLADEIAHALTGYLLVSLLIILGVPLSLPAAVLGSVIIDLDHIPEVLGWIPPPDETTRFITHSMATVAMVAAIGLFDRKRRSVWFSVAVGITLHLIRDMATGTVRFWWPISPDVHHVDYSLYAFVLGIAGVTIAFVSFVWPSRVPDVSVAEIRSFVPSFRPTGSKKEA